MEYRRKKGSYMFTDKKHPAAAIIAVVLAVIIFITICVLGYKSSLSDGNGPLLYGVICFVAMIASFTAFIVSVFEMRRKEIFYLFPILGAVLNGIIFLGLFVMYIVGASV